MAESLSDPMASGWKRYIAIDLHKHYWLVAVMLLNGSPAAPQTGSGALAGVGAGQPPVYRCGGDRGYDQRLAHL